MKKTVFAHLPRLAQVNITLLSLTLLLTLIISWRTRTLPDVYDIVLPALIMTQSSLFATDKRSTLSARAIRNLGLIHCIAAFSLLVARTMHLVDL